MPSYHKKHSYSYSLKESNEYECVTYHAGRDARAPLESPLLSADSEGCVKPSARFNDLQIAAAY